LGVLKKNVFAKNKAIAHRPVRRGEKLKKSQDKVQDMKKNVIFAAQKYTTADESEDIFINCSCNRRISRFAERRPESRFAH
jgi:hypothetical protein